jgi:poly(3-hydroxybutyrate) depolymerase
MASLVAAAYPELWSALALHSGLVYQAASTLTEALGAMQKGVPSVEPHAQTAFNAMGARRRVLPTLVVHGGSDAVVAPINGAQTARQWFLTNALTLGQPLDTTSGATDRSERVDGGYRVTSATYRAKTGTPVAVLLMVKELGHAWSGGSSDGTFTDPRGPDATARIFDFFASQAPR